MKHTKATGKLAVALMTDPNGRHYGYSLSKSAHMRSGVLYPILHRMLDAGWLTDGWEAPEDSRPRRRYYELTDLGRDELAGRAQWFKERT